MTLVGQVGNPRLLVAPHAASTPAARRLITGAQDTILPHNKG